ncbi:MAG: Cys-tRNA(Pro) deacylase [Nitrospirae bacterium]|nr:Cys-tRNA(Pro) deacylase [Nitrospirota bacterium]
MSEGASPVTRAAEVLRSAGVAFTDHSYSCDEASSTEACAKGLNIDEHSLVKTILLEADGKPFIVLMHGDMRASAKELARITGAKSITPCFPAQAEKYTGYQTGGISPFGAFTEMPVYMEETVLNLRKIYINGGRPGYFIGMDPYDLLRILRPTLVKVGAARAA